MYRVKTHFVVDGQRCKIFSIFVYQPINIETVIFLHEINEIEMPPASDVCIKLYSWLHVEDVNQLSN